jgi:pimeloyl-ACP methyl ester carboxylesterase
MVLTMAFSWSAAWSAEPSKKKVPEPEDVTLHTKDGVQLACTYYRSTLGKSAVPVIMLHGWGGQRSAYDALAASLQKMGHAVITVDLRGHGRSTTRVGPARRTEIHRDKMGRTDLSLMVLDIEAAKKKLLEENNQGALNIELLCVISSDVSTIAALNWAVMDWSALDLPTLKQGRDVKALVLISPQQTFKGFTSKTVFSQKTLAAAHVRSRLSVLILVGRDDPSAYAEAERLHNSFKRYHGAQPEEGKDRDSFFVAPATSLQGAQLLTARGLDVGGAIAKFINWRLVSKQADAPWTDRTNPLAK